MDFKNIQKQLQDLRDRIRVEGSISAEDEAELKALLKQTLVSASSELDGVKGRFTHMMPQAAGNDNMGILNEDQKARLDLVRKTGTGSAAIH